MRVGRKKQFDGENSVKPFLNHPLPLVNLSVSHAKTSGDSSSKITHLPASDRLYYPSEIKNYFHVSGLLTRSNTQGLF